MDLAVSDMTGITVQLTTSQLDSCGGRGINVGEVGTVVFDDGSSEFVVVEFSREVPHGDFPCDKKNQAWVQRSCIRAV